MLNTKFTTIESLAMRMDFSSGIWCVLKAVIYRPGNVSVYYPIPMQIDNMTCSGKKVSMLFNNAQQEVSLQLELSHNFSCWSGRANIFGKGMAIIQIIIELPEKTEGFNFVPAFMYGRNEGGMDPMAAYPMLRDERTLNHAMPWATEQWLVRADRSSHGFTSVIEKNWAIAIGGRDVCRYENGSVAEKNGLGVSILNSKRLSFSLGFANVPYTYSLNPIMGRNFISRPEGYVNLNAGSVESSFYIAFVTHFSRSEAARKLLQESYRIQHDMPVARKISTPQAIDDIGEAVVKYGYCEKAKNFFATFTDEKGDVRMMPFFASGWTGGVQVAYPLLMAGYRRKRSDWINHARDVLDNLAEKGISRQTGLFFDNYDLVKNEWNNKGWWTQKERHSGYVNGQACHYLLMSYLLEEKNEYQHTSWLESASRVLEHVADVQGADGRFGCYYSQDDGKISDGVGFAGCWFIPAFANLYHITKNIKYLTVARRGMAFYRQAVENFEVFGCPHDAFKSPDGEGILAWIAASRLLHEITGDEQFLNDLLVGLNYEFSWKFSYNVVNEVEPLKSVGWLSAGGSVTSVNNSHIHPMGSVALGNIFYAWNHTGDEYLKSRMHDTLSWTLNSYLHEDGQYGWGKKGMINERYCHTDSLLVERFSDGSPASTWFCGHSWASGSILEGLTADGIYDILSINDS